MSPQRPDAIKCGTWDLSKTRSFTHRVEAFDRTKLTPPVANNPLEGQHRERPQEVAETTVPRLGASLLSELDEGKQFSINNSFFLLSYRFSENYFFPTLSRPIHFPY